MTRELMAETAALLPLLAAAVMDARHRRFPDWPAALVLACALWKAAAAGTLWQSLAAGLGCGLLFLLAAVVTDGLGGADVKLLSALGALLGFSAALGVFCAAALPLAVYGRLRRMRSVPFAPFLLAAYAARRFFIFLTVL